MVIGQTSSNGEYKQLPPSEVLALLEKIIERKPGEAGAANSKERLSQMRDLRF